MKMVCADVGGTAVKSALISVGKVRLPQTYKLKNFFSTPTRSDLGFEGVRASILKAVQTVMTDDCADIVAIATAGEVNWEDGSVANATNSLPGFCGYSFAEDMTRELGRRTVVVNDACAAAVCAHYFRRNRTASTLVLTIGTGLGTALVAEGGIDGQHVQDLELGHRIFKENGIVCRCGKEGCLEQYLSATAIKRDAGTRTVKEALTNTDNKKCVEAKERFMATLSETLTLVKKEFAPSEILIGGGLAEMKNLWIDDFYRKFGHEDVRTVGAGNKAGLLGAAFAALNGVFAEQ